MRIGSWIENQFAMQQDSIDAKTPLPLPNATVGGRWNFSKKWQGRVRYELFYLEFDNYRGSEQEFLALFEHNTFKRIGFGGGFNTISLDLGADLDEFRGELDSRILGVLGYAKVYF